MELLTMKRKRDSSDTKTTLLANAGESCGYEFEVFLNFRGPDTRLNFVDCLYHFLDGAGIRVFRDNEEIRKGDVIGGELLRAIETSKIYMPIFSKDYASSAWCLRELASIVKCQRELSGKVILPVFYDVEPSDVKLQTRLYIDALERHEAKFGYDEVQCWKEALTEVANINGWDLRNTGQGELIKHITSEVSSKLLGSARVVPDHLVGIDYHVEAMMDLLGEDSLDVRFVIIHGMGGIGKTTLAKVVFNQISSQFHGCSFLYDIREFSRQGKMRKLQKQLLSDVLKSKAVKINDIDTGINMIREKFCCRKVLVVLDDVDKRDQLMKLAEKREWFGPGSRIIITTRDVSFFQNNGERLKCNDPMHPKLYEMEEMPFHYAIQLFSKHAFRRDAPPCNYDRIAREIVKTTGGLPLALVVIGSSLCCRDKEVWDDALEKLRKMPHKEVQDMLMISYDMLEYEQREIFLDIACLMAGEERSDAVCMWKACELYPSSTITALVEMSLIKITDDQKIWMHDQLKDLGREIVRRESIQHPGKRSRLWCPTVAAGVMRRNEGTENIVALKLGGDSELHGITREELLRLVKVRFLELDGGNFVGDFQDLLSELKWLSWHQCPSKFQATNFCPSNLVVLKISGSDITNDWDGWSQIMGKSRLKVLNLRCCRSLTKTPDFSTCLTLERLILKDCESLVEIGPSIGMLQNLKHLEINGCNGLRMLATTEQNLCLLPRFLPNSLGNLKLLSTLRMENMELLELPESIGDLTGLQHLSLSHSSVIDLPSSIGKLRSLVELTLSHTKVTELPDSIGELKRLEVLLMPGCKLRKLPKVIGMLEKLRELIAYECELLEGEVPSEIGALSSLRILDLGGTHICKLPSSINRLHQLESLHLFPCHKLPKLPELPVNLKALNFKSSALRMIPNVLNLTNLVALSLSDYGRPKFVAPSIEFGPHDERAASQTPDLRWIGSLRKLKRLKLELSDVTTLPAEVNSLTALRRLDLPWSTFQSHSQYPSNLQRLNLIGFESTVEWSQDYNFKNLSSFELCRSSLTDIPLDRLGQFENLRELYVTDCRLLVSLSNISSLRKLQRLWITNCPKLVDIRGLGQLELLEDLRIHGCVSLRELPDLSDLRNLMTLDFSGCKLLANLPPVANKEACRVNIHSCRMLRDFGGPYRLY